MSILKVTLTMSDLEKLLLGDLRYLGKFRGAKMSILKVTLTMSDLEKLLLDENGQIKIEIGEQIANEFAKKHLKSLVHDAIIREATKINMNDLLIGWVEQNGCEYPSVIKAKEHLSAFIKEHAIAHVNASMPQETRKVIDEAIKRAEEKYTQVEIQTHIQDSIDASIKRKIANGVKAAIEKALGEAG